ncbi:siderophore-interacting protein [Microlunatus flavus]|uniref:NADPH-dependent ferric siderophore reductase, contains FAD-binding and SIP domains n=1 Tax=Microlunatus flavus TaxID=1036181 RepID=A0A1H9L3E1_9ACTN|nr:siderophore-interacting protein [Microlunatus flavus]SER05974.1 NADPH-dependent ferric siderophore reductase, contains FAD-binding and SIP domains [Microlunatus flavus]
MQTATSTPRADAARPQRKRVVRRATVVSSEWLSPSMVRVFFTGPDLACMRELPFTDHYVKLLFPPAGAPYAWPFDPERVRAERAPEHWPVTRTYTVRSYDAATNVMAIDFVVHGDEGLAGPWARRVRPGAEIGFYGPGGAFAPDPEADAHLLIGDEAALPAIAASLERLDARARAHVFIEIECDDCYQPVPGPVGTTVTWVVRGERPHGEALAEAVRAAEIPDGCLSIFVHGNAYMVRDLRRFLCQEQALQRSVTSMSGYWRPGATEDLWQATKREFAATEAAA